MADNTPLTDRSYLERSLGGYTPPTPIDIPEVPHRAPSTPMPGQGDNAPSVLTALENSLLSGRSSGKLMGGGIERSLSELSSPRYSNFVPGNYNNEDAYAQGQGWTEKMVNDVGKGLLLTGTTFLQSTVGLVNGVTRAISDGRAASFYDNDFNRKLDEINKAAENYLPNYYTDVEKNAAWYSPSKLFTANFFWDGIIKNMGFAAGAALAGGVYAAGLKALPLTARLFSMGKAAETLAATEEGLLAADKVAETYGKVKSLSDRFLGTYKTLDVGQRALVAGLATTGEAGFEAYNNMNQFRDEKIQQWKDTHFGQEPIGADLDKINQEAEGVGNSSFLLNVGLLSATNYIQFPKILGSSYTAEKGVLNAVTTEIEDIATDAAGKFIKAPSRLGRVSGLANKIRPYLFSASEGFEEGAQYAIQVGTQDYYNKKYRNQATSFLDSLSQGITQTVGTDEGMENVLIGGLSGALMQAKGKFSEAGELSKNTAAAIQAFNKWNLSDFTRETIDSVNRGTVLQEQREASLRKGDVLNSKDLEADYIINYLTPRIKYGRYDLVRSDIEDYKRLATTDEGFAQLQSEGKALSTDTKEQYLQRLTNLETTANNVKSLYQSLNLRYANLVNAEGKRVYSPEVIDKMIYAASKTADYDVRLPKLTLSLSESGVDTTSIIQDIIKGNKPNEEATNTALSQINDLDVNDDIKDELKTNLSDAIELATRRKLFMEEYNDIKKNPSNYAVKPEFEFGATEELPVTVKQEEKVEGKKKPQVKEVELEVGKEYSLAEPVRREGNTLQLAPKLTVVSQTLGGELEVKLPNGDVTFLTPEQFKAYKISDVDNTSEKLATALDTAINTVLGKSKYADISVPEGKNALDFVNSLDNEELVNDIETEFKKTSEDIIKQEQKQAEELEVVSNPQVSKSLINTLDNSQPTLQATGNYKSEAKKSDRDVVAGTVATTGKPHHERANLFGNKLDSLPNRKDIRGVYVTLKNEAALGLKGLMEHIKGDSDADVNKTIALVMVDKSGKPVGVDGKVVDVPTVDNTIYQVFPLEDLEWDDKWSKTPGQKISMFRDSTAQEVVDALKEQYKAWRENTLNNPTLTPFEITASFGNPDFVRDADGNRVYDAKVALEDSGLVTKSALTTNRVVFVPTVENTISKGSTNYNNAKGLPFLNTANGYVKLNNRKLTNNEVNAVFDAILQLSKNVTKDKNANSKESKRLYNWLKSIVYWGTPEDSKGVRKDASSNSVWFERTASGLTLFISNQNESVPFTPTSIEENEAKIKGLLKDMYHTVNATLTKGGEGISWNDKYEQITSVSKDGKVTAKTWKNYQTYLVAKEGRVSEDVPLTTNIRALSGPTDTNRKGVYFTVTKTAESYTIPEVKPVEAPVAPTPKTLTPGAPKVAEAPKYKLDGSQETYTSPGGKVINFAAVAADVLKDNLAGIKVAIGGDVAEVLNDMMTKNNLSKEDAQKQIKSAIYKAIEPSLKEKAETPIEEQEFVIEGDDVDYQLPQEAKGLFAKQANTKTNRSALRVKLLNEIEQFEGENWTKVESWLKENFPNLPVYRVKNIINATNGRQAWGMLQDGAIYLYENAEVGTIYHEVFEGVWKMFTNSEERQAIVDEFKNREGSFVDRPTGETIKYSEATDEQIKEQLAEEFRDYTLNKEAKKEKSLIAQLFSDIVNFIKEFFTGKNAEKNTKELFSKIGNGYFAKYAPYAANLSFAKKGLIDIEDAYASNDSEFRLKDIRGEQIGDIVQHMTYTALTSLIADNKSLFSLGDSSLNKTDLYNKLKEEVQTIIAQKAGIAQQLEEEKLITKQQADQKIQEAIFLWKNITEQWDELVSKHEEKLAGYGIQFDENDDAILNDEDASKKDDYQEANKIDSFKKANAAIKLLLSTIPITRTAKDGSVETIPSSVNGVMLLPTSQVYMAILNNVSSAKNIDEMLEGIRKMAKADTNYQALYKRLTKNQDLESPATLTNSLTDIHDVQLLTAFWKTFKKQNPDVKNIYILENGDVVVGESNFTTAANQIREKFNNDIVKVIKGSNPYFKYDEKERAYFGKPGSVSKVSETLDGRIAFLKSLGIEFNRKEVVLNLNSDEQKVFNTAVEGIKQSINGAKKIATVSGKILDISGRLRELALLKAKLENPEFSSTFFNVNGERTQTYIGTNPVSDLFDFLSQLDRFDASTLAGTQYEYLLTDSFAKNSVLIKSMFNENGDRIEDSKQLFKPGYVDGLVDLTKGKKKQSSKLTYKERLVQELNLNLKGFYLNLVPGDASMEWMINMGNPVTSKSLLSGMDDVNEIFKGYFIDELNLSREEREIAKVKGRETTDLRFLKPILGEELHNSLIKEEGTPEEIYERNADKINEAVAKFIEKDVKSFKSLLEEYQIIRPTEEGYTLENVAFAKSENLSEEELNSRLTYLNINFMINNIEMHKVLYSDPYQYKDELKRIKSFNSPRQSIISNSADLNSAMNKFYNRGYEEGDLGYTDMTRDFFRSITLSDVEAVADIANYGSWEETDGGGIISMKAYRNFRIRSGEWNDAEEKQYKYDVAYEKEAKRIPLSPEEKQLIIDGNPAVTSAYTPIKPIVAGNKANGQKYNDVVLDKFALYPLSYRVASEINKAGGKTSSNAINQYNKMQAEDIDYAVFGSGRKVGAIVTNDIYNEDGSFNETPYEGITNIPFSIMSVQSEVPSKDQPLVTRGSQTTKMITMDFLELGIPVDFEEGGDINERYDNWNKLTEEEKLNTSELYKEVKNNENLLVEMMDADYKSLLKKLSIKETNGVFEITDFSNAAKTLRDEIFKNEVNDNISDALQGFLNGDVILEATPAYKQVRNILYSIADKKVISPKINGGQKVQIPATFLEQTKTKKVEINGKTGYTSDTLKFYEDKDGKRYCEIMVGRWFSSKMSDKELLDYLNNTEEGQKVLSGLAFRIPTQKQNSIDAFVIKQFLPKEFGDSVVIPSELVKKVGSDFDIDKLSIYLKNVYTNGKGEIKLVPYFGTGEEAKQKVKDLLVKEDIDYVLFSEREKDLSKVEDDYDTSADRFYKKSLENAYIESCEKLVTHPKNFERLIQPNSADQLKGLANKITAKRGLEAFDYSSTKNLISRKFMSRLRHAFVTGKYAIGIAAVNQTNHSLNQRTRIYVDKNRMGYLSDVDRHWLKDGEVKFEKFNRVEVNGEMVPTLSMIKNADGQDISDIIGQFIDGYVDISKGPWIMELGATPNVASTFLFLTKIGVPIDDVVYFMNQPIIRDYLAMVENSGYSWLFIEDYVDSIKNNKKYNVPAWQVRKIKSIPSKNELFNTIGQKTLTVQEMAQQQFMLDEFLKYAKMAQQMFLVTQGSNFDTSNFNDPYLVFKKFEQLKRAQNTIISSVNDILNNSFLGKLGYTIGNIRDAYATILFSDSKFMRGIMENVLRPYVDMSDRDFVKIAQKAVSDVFDWAVQNNEQFNLAIQDVLLSDTKSAAIQFDNFVKDIKKDPMHPLYNNQIINSYDPKFSSKPNGVNNLSIINKDNKVYDQNQTIYAFNELKSHLKSIDNPELYDNLIKAAVLQSGLSNSAIAFTSLLPYEDFKDVYNKTLSRLENLDNFTLNDYLTLDVFQRNNWSDDDITPYRKATWRQGADKQWRYNSAMRFYGKQELNTQIQFGNVPPLVKLSTLARGAEKDIIVYSWEDQTISKKEKQEMRKIGDYSFIKKGLFKKVYDNGVPLTTTYKKDGQLFTSYVYKAINAWGDSFRANEFYSTAEKSVIDNGFIQVNEVVDEKITPFFVSTKEISAETVETSEPKTDNWEEEENTCPNPF